MTTAAFIKKPKRLRRLREGPLGAYLELFSARLLTEGHCQQSAWRNIRVMDDFGRWLVRKGIAIGTVDEAIVDRYMQFRARCRHPFLSDRPALNRFLAMLRELDVIVLQRPRSLSPHEQIVEDFKRHLRQDGGFEHKIIITHLPTLRRFIAEQCATGSGGFAMLKPADIIAFIARHAPHQSTRSTQRVCSCSNR